MNKSNLSEQIAGSTGRTRKETEQIIDTVLAHITASLAKGEKVDLRGFGSFQINEKKERQGRNPKTGETLIIPARRAVVFKPAKELAARVNETPGAGEVPAEDDMLSAELSPGSAKVHGDKLENTQES